MKRRLVCCVLWLIASPVSAESKHDVEVAPGVWSVQRENDGSVMFYECFNGDYRMWDDSSNRNSCRAQTGVLAPKDGRARRFSIRTERRDWIEGGAYRTALRCVTEVTPDGLPSFEDHHVYIESSWSGDFSREVLREIKTSVASRAIPRPTVIEGRAILSRLGQCPVSMKPGTSCRIGPYDQRNLADPRDVCDERTTAEIRRLEAALTGRQ
jgi:hypothetical protein